MLTRRHKVMLALESNPGLTALELTNASREKACNVRSYLMWAEYSGAATSVKQKGRKSYTVAPGWKETLAKHEAKPNVRAGDGLTTTTWKQRKKETNQTARVSRIDRLMAAAQSVRPEVKTHWVRLRGKDKPHHWHLSQAGVSA